MPSPTSLSLVCSFSIAAILWISTVVASNDCAPVTWLSGTCRRDVEKLAAEANIKLADVNIHLARTVSSTSSAASPSKTPIQPGEINCRFWFDTFGDVNYYTCTEIAEQFGTDLDLFFSLNLTLKWDCSNI